MDNFECDGEDIYKDNLGEEFNYYGMLNEFSDEIGVNYGYFMCFVFWLMEDFLDCGDFIMGD